MGTEASKPSDHSSSSHSIPKSISRISLEQQTRDMDDSIPIIETSPNGKELNETINLDDSDGSIYEVPVPPKPKPPLINLDDESSDIESSIEILTPREPSPRNHQAGRGAGLGAENIILPFRDLDRDIDNALGELAQIMLLLRSHRRRISSVP